MPGYKPIDPAVKAEILDQIRNQGVSVSEMAYRVLGRLTAESQRPKG